MDKQPVDLISWYKTFKKASGLSLDNISSMSCRLFESTTSITPRTTATVIAIIGLISCSVETWSLRCSTPTVCERGEWCRCQVVSMKRVLLSLYQVGNLLLLVAAAVESAAIVQIYLWCTMSYVVLGLAVALTDLLVKFKREGAARACYDFVPEVAFLFVLFRCLPLVDRYGRTIVDPHLYSI